MNNCWLPPLECFNGNLCDWNIYQEKIYNIFKKDFIESFPYFQGLQVNIRKQPISYGKEEAFFHITCQDFSKDGHRNPDFRRCERIRWVRAFIENYQCNPNLCDSCDGIKVWKEPYKNTERVHILLEEERYIVVIELRKKYCLLVTAFYLDQDHALQKKLNHYNMYASK